MLLKTKVASIAIALMLVGGVLIYALTEQPQIASKTPVIEQRVIALPSTSGRIAPSSVLASASAIATVRAQRPATTASSLGRQLLDATDLRTFVLDALKQPEKGGAFYASLALGLCSIDGVAVTKAVSDKTIQRVIARESTISTERMEAIGATIARCAGFLPGEMTALSEQVEKHLRDGSDPLFAIAVKSWNAHVYSREYAQGIDEIFKSGNAALMSSQALPLGFVMTLNQRDMRLVYRYNGQTYTDETDQQALSVGAMWSVCPEDDFCRFDEQTIMACRHDGDCYASREEYVRKVLLRNDPDLYDKARKIRDEMRTAIARGDRSIFR